MTPDEQLQARAIEAATREARRRGWLAAGEVLPTGDEPQTGASVATAILAKGYLAELRGEPSALTLECRRRSAAHEERMREQDARERAKRLVRFGLPAARG